jgi:hypothetical protein
MGAISNTLAGGVGIQKPEGILDKKRITIKETLINEVHDKHGSEKSD